MGRTVSQKSVQMWEFGILSPGPCKHQTVKAVEVDFTLTTYNDQSKQGLEAGRLPVWHSG